MSISHYTYSRRSLLQAVSVIVDWSLITLYRPRLLLRKCCERAALPVTKVWIEGWEKDLATKTRMHCKNSVHVHTGITREVHYGVFFRQPRVVGMRLKPKGRYIFLLQVSVTSFNSASRSFDQRVSLVSFMPILTDQSAAVKVLCN